MSYLGLDLNATALRAVRGNERDYPLAVSLETESVELPMAVRLDKRTLPVGSAARSIIRSLPHLACSNFLPHLGEQGPLAKTWRNGRLAIDADAALASILAHLKTVVRKPQGIAAAVPSYISNHQLMVLHKLFAQAKLPLAGTLTAPLSAALLAYAEQAWEHSALIIDVDHHALTLAWVKATEGNAYLIDLRHLVPLSLRHWKERLVNALADDCVRQTRKDPRDNPAADQALYEQVDRVMTGISQGRMVQLGVQGNQWYQNLLVSPEKAQNACAALLRTLRVELDRMLQDLPLSELPTFILTYQASLLPGVASLARYKFAEREATQAPPQSSQRKSKLATSEDFGLELFLAGERSGPRVVALPPDALARGAHLIVGMFAEGAIETHLDAGIPLPFPHAPEFGPARLHFQGQDFFLSDPHIAVGSQVGCHIHFEPQHHPHVDARHCELHFDRQHYVLFNRSPVGTLVNDSRADAPVILQAGDLIRLGERGPTLRFLGQGRLSG